MDRFPGWTAKDDAMSNKEQSPADVWNSALSDAENQIDALYDDVMAAGDRAATDDPEVARRMAGIAAKAKALREELAQVLKDA